MVCKTTPGFPGAWSIFCSKEGKPILTAAVYYDDDQCQQNPHILDGPTQLDDQPTCDYSVYQQVPPGSIQSKCSPHSPPPLQCQPNGWWCRDDCSKTPCA